MSKSLTMLAVLASASFAWCTASEANTFSFVTPPGSIGTGGFAVDASTTITTAANEVDISLTNLATMHDISQMISDLSVTLSTTPTSAATYPSSFSVNTVSLDASGNGTLGTKPYTGNTGPWGLTTSGSTITLNDLSGGSSPTLTIIGPPTSGTTWPTTDGLENASHQPYIDQTFVVHLVVAGVTALTNVTGVVFSFGTSPGSNFTGVPSTTPLPGAAFLFGSVLIGGLGVSGWRKRRNRGPASVMA